jgi:large subunit ribosomal protein L15
MKYHELTINSHKKAKRVGRGIAAGGGKTAGRGTKGQNARTGGGVRPGFEGGQTPLVQRLPKLRGFRSVRVAPETVYTGQLEQFGGKTVDSQVLAEAGIISNAFVAVKLVVKGQLTKKVTVKLPAASAAAIALVQKAGGKFEATPQLGRPAKSKSQK